MERIDRAAVEHLVLQLGHQRRERTPEPARVVRRLVRRVRVLRDGGVLDFNGFIGSANQTYAACSTNATLTYPYGNTYVQGNCNTKDLYEGGVGAGVADTKSFAQCAGGFAGIYDITGNVEEWMDSCLEKGEGGANDPCHESGDCFDYTATGPARCDNNDSDNRTSRGPDIGIRCCSP
jgi:hypothetical protein